MCHEYQLDTGYRVTVATIKDATKAETDELVLKELNEILNKYSLGHTLTIQEWNRMKSLENE